MRFSIVTLGCKVNAYESQYYATKLKEAGFEEVDQDMPCDLFIINTCTVTNTAAQKSRQKIHLAKRKNPLAKIIVVGCYAQHASLEQRQAMQADLIVGAKHKSQLVDLIQEMLVSDKPMDTVEQISQFDDFEAMPIHCFESKHRAFLKIEDGCNQFCSYCAIPLARGPERSLACKQVLSIAKELEEKGHREIVLTGIHTGRYLDGAVDLAGLLTLLLDSTKSVNFRISSIEITEVSDALIELMKNNDRLLPHLHIPLQAGCNETLARMNRPYTVEDFLDRLQYIRSQIPMVSISTDVICGFVQESNEEFETTKQTIQDCKFSFLHVFPYSRRDGTKASEMKGQIPGDIAKARTKELLDLSVKMRHRDMDRFDTIQVMTENYKDGYYTGYTAQYHPVKIYTDETLSSYTGDYDRIEDNHYIVDLRKKA